MRLSTITFAVLAAALAAGAGHAQTTGTDQPDSSANTLCWDTLQNVARERTGGEGKVGPTGDLRGQTTGSSAENKVQGPGAEPKDSNRVTSGVTNDGRMTSGSTIRPAGIPNC